jgi:hypothetical protein
MAKFAKLIELDNQEQVLIYLFYNDDDEVYEMHIRTDFEDLVAQSKMTFKNQEAAIKALEGYSHEKALKYRTELFHILFT